jgi:hypothetical protein
MECSACFDLVAQPHTLIYIDKDSYCHTAMCPKCNYSNPEAHTPDITNTVCTKCSRLGPFSMINKTIVVVPEEQDHSEDLPEE